MARAEGLSRAQKPQPPLGVATLGDVTGQLLGGHTGQEQLDQAADANQRTARRMVAILIERGGIGGGKDGSGTLREPLARKIADAVMAGWLPWETVERLLADGDLHVMRDPARTPAAWCYLIGTMPKVFADHGHCWYRDGRKLPPRKPR